MPTISRVTFKAPKMQKPRRATSAARAFGSSRGRLSLLALLPALALVSIGTTGTAVADSQTIPIGFATPLAASVGGFGKPASQGLQLAIKRINAAGGIKGAKLSAQVQDDACTSAGGATAVQKLLSSSPKPVAILGGFCSDSVLAMLPIIKRAEVPLLVDEASNPTITQQKNPWVFRWVNNDDESAAGAIQALKVHHIKSIAIVADNLAFGRGGGAALTKYAKAAGIKVLSADYVDTTSADFEPILARLAAEKPQAVAVWMTQAGTFYSQYGESGLKSVPLAGQVDLSQKAIVTDKLRGWDTFQYSIAENTPQNKQFLAAWKGAGLPDTTAAVEAGFNGYEAAYVLAAALKNAKSFTPAAIQTALKHLNFGPTLAGGRIQFDSTGQAHDNVPVVSFDGAKQTTSIEKPSKAIS